MLQGFVLRPGHENFVAMGVVSTKAEPRITIVPPRKRGCYFPNEFRLEMHMSVIIFKFKTKLLNMQISAILFCHIYDRLYQIGS